MAINRLLKRFRTDNKNNIPNRIERLEWILEHVTPETKQSMLIAVIIEIIPELTLQERKLVQQVIERCQ